MMVMVERWFIVISDIMMDIGSGDVFGGGGSGDGVGWTFLLSPFNDVFKKWSGYNYNAKILIILRIWFCW